MEWASPVRSWVILPMQVHLSHLCSYKISLDKRTWRMSYQFRLHHAVFKGMYSCIPQLHHVC